MAEIRWTPQGVDDLEAIIQFISKDSPFYARLFAVDVIKAIDRLTDFPKLGRVVPELKNSYIREILTGNYRIVYRLRRTIVEVLTVYHGAKLLNPSKLK